MSTDVALNKAWEIQIECFPKLNFALQQSSVPFIRHISICNNTDEGKDIAPAIKITCYFSCWLSL